MSCHTHCPHTGRSSRGSRQRPEAVRRKLEFSDPVSETSHQSPPPANKYDHFKKVSETHSSHIMEPPMYSGAFDGKRDAAAGTGSQRRAAVPQREEAVEAEMPDSFLEFCQAKIAARPTPEKTPPRRPISDGSYYVQGPTPYNTSYYGYEDPAAQHGMIFNPRITSTPCSPRRASPNASPQAYYYPPPFQYYAKARSYEMENLYPPLGADAVGIGKYAYPASSSPPTPLTPQSACGGPCANSGRQHESTVSSGDFLGSSSRKGASGRRSAGINASASRAIDHRMAYRYPTPPPDAIGIGKYACPASHSPVTPPTPPSACGGQCNRNSTFDDTAIGAPLAQSTPINVQFKYETSSARRDTSTSSILGARRGKSDTVCTDDMLESRKSRCPTLGVTPVHSEASVSSYGENMASENRRKISKSIETELRAREVQERNQLESDLERWQKARRRLVMNTANMGA